MGSNIHVLSVPSLSPRALAIRAGLLLDTNQGSDVVGARNAFGLINALVKRGVDRLLIPGFESEVFRYGDQVTEEIFALPSKELSRLHSAGSSNPLEVVTLEVLQEETELPHMEQDVYGFRPGVLEYRLQKGWRLRGRQGVEEFYGWIFVKK